MTVGMKVSLVVLVLFGAVLAFYYGLGTPRATRDQIAVEPPLLALQPPKATARPDAVAADSPPRVGDIAQTTQGVLSESVQRAIGARPEPSGEPRNTITGRLDSPSVNVPPRSAEMPADRNHVSANTVEPEVPANDPLAKSPNTPRPMPARMVPYTVKQDDSLWTIADAWFGDAGRWDLIAKANPLIDPDRLKPGQVIRLPAKDAVRRPVRRARITPTDPGAYVVRSGDSLSRIARVHYGDESKWFIIYDANRSTIGPDPAHLTVGRSLRIPPQTRSVGR